MAERRLTVLIALGDAGRAERLAAAMAASGLEPVLSDGSASAGAADVSVVDGSIVALPPHVLLAGARPLPDIAEPAATLSADADEALIVAAARLAAAGYHVAPNGQAGRSRHNGFAHDADAFGDDTHDETPIRPVLSARESEVLALLAEGAPNKVIARRLDISVHTAKFHVAAILAKLGAANRTDAIGIAMRQGLVLV